MLSIIKTRQFYLLLLLFLFVFFGANELLASTGGSDLPFVGPLEKLKQAITGPVAKVISLIGVVAAGGGLLFGGSDMSGFMKTLVSLVLVISLILGAANIIDLAGGSSALIY